MPGENDLAAILPLHVLPDVGLQNFVRNAELRVAPKQLLFVEVITIGAVQIADRADGLDQLRDTRVALRRAPAARIAPRIYFRSLPRASLLTERVASHPSGSA